jgi:CubicO group peptidase (beta-lactamase class C family)
MKARMEPVDYLKSLFSGASQIESFQAQREMFPTARMSASPNPRPFPKGAPMALPATYTYGGTSKDLQGFLEETETMALVVLKEGTIRHEKYADWGGPDAHWISMSVAKSFVSAAIGIALDEGLIKSIEQPVSDYVPALGIEGSAYTDVRIKDILQMSSGAGWNEDYSDPNSDITRFLRVLGTGSAINDFPSTLKRAREPGTFNLYNSTDTQVLGMLLVAVTGRSIADYMQEKLWHPLGMETDGYWIVDSTGMEMAYGGLNAIARDYAKIGELYRLNGKWDGKQIISETWVKASVTPDAPHLMPGDTGLSDSVFGYGYQWWVPEGNEGEYSAIGVYNQFVYVNPTKRVVIVKLSANRRYGLTNDEAGYRELETIAFLRAIAAAA